VFGGVVGAGFAEEGVEHVHSALVAGGLVFVVLVHPPGADGAAEGEVDGQSGVVEDGHVFPGPAVEAHDGGASGDQAAGLGAGEAQVGSREDAGQEDAV
jgi:hypothetical protein